MCERNICQVPLAHPQLGTWSTTQACALTGNQTSDLLVHRPVLNPLSHTSWGRNLFVKKLCIYSYVFELQSSSRYSPSDAVHTLRQFLHHLTQFLNSSIWMPFSFCHFFFHLFYTGKTFPFEDFFHQGNKKKVVWGKIV